MAAVGASCPTRLLGTISSFIADRPRPMLAAAGAGTGAVRPDGRSAGDEPRVGDAAPFPHGRQAVPFAQVVQVARVDHELVLVPSVDEGQHPRRRNLGDVDAAIVPAGLTPRRKPGGRRLVERPRDAALSLGRRPR